MKKRVILISGMSGAGKSSVTSILEDMGYHCMENFPVQLLSALVDMIEHSTDVRYNSLVLSTSAKDFPEYLHVLTGSTMNVQVLFLDASNEELLHRYKLTRRNHPLFCSNVCHTLEEAIEEERRMFQSVKDKASLIIDTTFLKTSDLKSKVQEYFSLSSKPVFTISFMSFGYKHGVPRDADCMLDVRFLPNPYWEVELRPYSGDDECVYNYVMNKPETQEFCKRMISFLDFAFERYVREGKNHFTVAVGCTGGQHRSVSITNYLYQHYKDQYHCYKEHRDKQEVYHDQT